MIMSPIRTDRLLLIPATAESTSFELAQHDQLAMFLNCRIPPSWPPMNVRDVLSLFESILRDHPDQVGWHGWYWIANDQPELTLVGSGGFRGPPQVGQVEIGYGTLEIFHRQGYATEAVRALCDHAFHDPRVRTIIADTDATNIASQRVLTHCGFFDRGPAGAGRLRYHRRP